MAIDKTLSALKLLLYQVRAVFVVLDSVATQAEAAITSAEDISGIRLAQDIAAVRFALMTAHLAGWEVAIEANKTHADQPAAEETAAIHLH